MNAFQSKRLAIVVAAAFLCLSLGGVIAEAGGQKAKVNINTAAVSELESLPRIGPKVAQRIVDFRAQNGNFKKIEEIMKVRGIGEKIFEQIKDLITVGSEGQGK